MTTPMTPPTNDPRQQATQIPECERLARRFHTLYERLAPQFGYETRAETREFDPQSPNGKLMMAVCAALSEPAPGATGDAVREIPTYNQLKFLPNHRVHTWCDVCGRESAECIAFEYLDGTSWRSGDACPDCVAEMGGDRAALAAPPPAPATKKAPPPFVPTQAGWLPGGSQGNRPMFTDGERYLFAVPVREGAKEYWEYFVVSASVDSETPVTFNEESGDAWAAWDWLNVEWYMPMSGIAPAPATNERVATSGEHDVFYRGEKVIPIAGRPGWFHWSGEDPRIGQWIPVPLEQCEVRGKGDAPPRPAAKDGVGEAVIAAAIDLINASKTPGKFGSQITLQGPITVEEQKRISDFIVSFLEAREGKVSELDRLREVVEKLPKAWRLNPDATLTESAPLYPGMLVFCWDVDGERAVSGLVRSFARDPHIPNIWWVLVAFDGEPKPNQVSAKSVWETEAALLAHKARNEAAAPPALSAPRADAENRDGGQQL